MKRVFVVDDERNIRELIRSYLEKEGYGVAVFSNAAAAADAFAYQEPDAMILDIMMPGKMDGLELCKLIRQTSELPIVFVSAKDEAIDRILGLELGADDYLSKPFSPRELVVRLKTIFKRMESAGVPKGKSLQVRDLMVDEAKREAKVGETILPLTNNEYLLLHFFALHPNISFSREHLIEQIWHYDHLGDTRMIDDLIKRIRKKMRAADAQAEIVTVWGFGYRMDGGHED